LKFWIAATVVAIRLFCLYFKCQFPHERI